MRSPNLNENMLSLHGIWVELVWGQAEGRKMGCGQIWAWQEVEKSGREKHLSAPK